MTKRRMMVHRDTKVIVSGGKFVNEPRERIVRVLATAEGWAMVRPTGFATYCVPLKQLRELGTEKEPK